MWSVQRRCHDRLVPAQVHCTPLGQLDKAKQFQARVFMGFYAKMLRMLLRELQLGGWLHTLAQIGFY